MEQDNFSFDTFSVEDFKQRLDEIVALQNVEKVRENLHWFEKFFEAKETAWPLLFSNLTFLPEIERKLRMVGENIIPRFEQSNLIQRSIASNIRLFLLE